MRASNPKGKQSSNFLCFQFLKIFKLVKFTLEKQNLPKLLVARKTLLYPFRQLSKALPSPAPKPPAKKKFKINLKKEHAEFSQDDNGPNSHKLHPLDSPMATWEWWIWKTVKGNSTDMTA
jgi:hypothetical protein